MIVTAAILFAVAAVGGLVLGGINKKGAHLPMPLALIHGAVAAVALVLLIIGAFGAGAAGAYLIPLILFVVAALGGFYLFAHHLRGTRLPVPAVAIHALVAVVGFAVLLVKLL